MALKLIIGPTDEPVTLAEAKSHLRVTHSDDDALITAMIAGARGLAEQFMARALITQTWELTLDEFPDDEIMIPLPPLQSVTSVKYDDGDGVEQTLATTEYTVDDQSEPAWIVPPLTGWPSTFEGINAVRVRFVAGYTPGTGSPVDPAENVPPLIRSAILLQVGNLYANRESIIVGTTVGQIPGGILDLLRNYRVALGFA